MIYFYEYEEIGMQADEGSMYYGHSYFVRTSGANNKLGSTSGSHIGYSEVTEIQGDANSKELGRTVYRFTSPEDQPDIHQVRNFPFPPPNSKDWKRGLPTETEYYDADNNLIKKEVYSLMMKKEKLKMLIELLFQEAHLVQSGSVIFV